MKILIIHDAYTDSKPVYLLYDALSIHPNDIKHYVIDAVHNHSKDIYSIAKFLCDGNKFIICHDTTGYDRGVEMTIYKSCITVEYKTYTGTVYFDKANGNCVDTFMRNSVDDNIKSIRMCANEILSRLYYRTKTDDYHNSAVYEQDIRDLMDMKNYCQKLNDKCDKMIKHLTMI